MAIDHQIVVDGHPSIYEPKERKLNIYYSEPSRGINEETGLLLLIAGFGGHVQSNVYKKMRSQFADEYNLVTVQCDYFGWEFMQEVNVVDFNISNEFLKRSFTNAEIEDICRDRTVNSDKILQYSRNHEINLNCRAKLDENLTNFNDMGFMQALDNINAVLSVISLINHRCEFNAGKIINYGHSHGAFLCYLCNVLCPGLFSAIVDNSAWLSPAYFEADRILIYRIGDATLNVAISYLARTLNLEQEITNLFYLYERFSNKAKIISFHGTTDNIVNHFRKRHFLRLVNNYVYYEISSDMVDGTMIKSTDHGLNADFLELFAFVAGQDYWDFAKRPLHISNFHLTTDNYEYTIDYSGGLPVVEVHDWEKI